MHTSKDELLGWFETMYRMRRVEVMLNTLYKGQHIRGFCHLYDGQEAVITGLHSGSTANDSIITSYRDHPLHLLRGGTVKEVIGELLGKSVGASRGVGGSMHLYNKAHNFYGGCGIVGAQVCGHTAACQYNPPRFMLLLRSGTASVCTAGHTLQSHTVHACADSDAQHSCTCLADRRRATCSHAAFMGSLVQIMC